MAPLTLSLLVAVTPMAAQRGPRATILARNAQEARAALDGWIVTRFRGAQLLDDSLAMRPRVADTSARAPVPLYPRVESVQESATGDTLFALHFGAEAGAVPLRDLSTVRMSAPSGAITTQDARMVARRAFRAPRLPNAQHDNAAAWRYGWAYMLVTRGRRPSQGFRGWLLLTLPDSVPTRAPTGSPRVTRPPAR